MKLIKVSAKSLKKKSRLLVLSRGLKRTSGFLQNFHPSCNGRAFRLPQLSLFSQCSNNNKKKVERSTNHEKALSDSTKKKCSFFKCVVLLPLLCFIFFSRRLCYFHLPRSHTMRTCKLETLLPLIYTRQHLLCTTNAKKSFAGRSIKTRRKHASLLHLVHHRK